MTILRAAQIALATLALACSASITSAAEVSCGDSSLGVRLTAVDPGLVGGYCYAQTGNLQAADITALGLTQIDKNNVGGIIGFTGAGGSDGTWSFPLATWANWGHLYLGFHFGGADGFQQLGDPDSFIIELGPVDTAGTWKLTGTNAKLTGLSNIYLLGRDRSTFCVNPGACPRNTVPEPSPLALLGLLLLIPLIGRRRSR